MRKFSLAASLAVGALVLAGCGAAPEEKPAADGTASQADAASADFKACMVSDAGGFDDKSFNQSGKEGLDRAKTELGVSTADAQSRQESDYTPNINALIKDGCNMIVGVGFLMADAMGEAAKANPDVEFALVDSPFTIKKETVTLDNAKPLLFNTAEAGYLAGYVAAGVSKTGKVGTFLGMKIPTTSIFADGFADGIAKYNETKGKSVALLGWDKAAQDGQATGNFEDISKGKTTAEALFNQGADIVMPVAGPVGAGALEAAKAAESGGHYVIWVDADGYNTNPDYKDLILTSVMKEIGAAVFDTIKEAKDGKFSATPYVGTLANGGVGIAPYHDLESMVSPDLAKEVEDLKAQIIDGKIKVETPNAPA